MSKFYTLFTVCLLSVLLPVRAETFDAPLVEKSLLLDADNANALVVVGERGHVIVSSDNGLSFKQVKLPVTSTLTGVDVRGDKVWAVGHDATILFSPDLGETWSIQNHDPDLEKPFLDVLFFDDSHGIAIGAYGLFYRTRDGGASWSSELHASLLNPYDIEYLEEVRAEDEVFYQQELSSILPHLNRVTEVNKQLFIAGETGLLAISDDKGENWRRYDIDYAGSFFDITPIDDSHVLAVGLRGTIYLKDVSDTWRRVNSCLTSTLNTAIKTLGNEALVVGNNGAIVKIDIAKLIDNPSAPCNSNGLEQSQLATKSAIATVFATSDNYTAVTSDGLQPLAVK